MTSVNPPWSRLITDANFHVSGCKIMRPQLDKIWNLATEGFSSDAFIRISTERRTGELSSEFEGTTIDAVVEAVRCATLPGDPNNIDNLQMVISERGSPRSVSIMIGGTVGSKVEVSVTGDSPGWVRGRVGGLRELFAEARNGWYIGNGQIRFYLASSGFLAGFPVNVIVAGLLPFVHTILARSVLFAGGLAILTSICYLFGSWMDRRSRTELRLHVPRKAKVDMGVWAIVVGIIGVLVAIISSLAAHHVFPAHAYSPGRQGTTPGPAGGQPTFHGLGAPRAHAGDNLAQAAGNQAAVPPTYPGLGAGWALAGVNWVPVTVAGSQPGDPPAFPGLGAGWAQAGVSWAQATGSP